MKALTLLQPWASLLVGTLADGTRPKAIETRSWGTSYRGRLLITASARISGTDAELACGFPFGEVLERLGYAHPGELPLGCALGTVELIECRRISDDNTLTLRRPWVPACDSLEARFGDFSLGRWMWITERPARFPVPIPIRGQRGLWEADAAILAPLPGAEAIQGVLL